MNLNDAFAAKLTERAAAKDDSQAQGGAQAVKPRPCVLVVDDEPEITRSLAELLRRRYTVFTANSVGEALPILTEHRVAVLLTDERMPDVTGTGLLALARDLTPDTTRILFTGFSDIAAVIEAVNQGQVFRYVAKPWPPDELLAIVARGVERHRLVTENRRLLGDLQRSYDELEAAHRELRGFVFSISHDQHSPLRALDRSSLALLDDLGEDLDATARGHLARIRGAARRLSELCDAQLTLVEVGQAKVEVSRVDLSALAQGVADALRDSAPERVVGFDIAEGLSADTDPAFIALVLEHLLGNAWRATAERASAHIGFGARDDDGTAVFFVHDDGAGFDAESANKLLAPFVRLSDAQLFAGDGVGLAIVQRVLQRLGGRCWAEGEIGKGATFFFTV